MASVPAAAKMAAQTGRTEGRTEAGMGSTAGRMRNILCIIGFFPYNRPTVPEREDNMKITGLDAIEKVKMTMEGAKNVLKQVPLSKNDGAPNFSFRVFTIEPGGHTPYHKHSVEHMNYIIEGQGAVVDEAGKEHPVKKGEFVLVLPDEKHQYKNVSTKESMIMICAVPKEYE